MSSQLDRIESMLRSLCAHLGVQSTEQSGNGGQHVFDPDAGRRYAGVVARFEHGWGFIECEAMNRNFFVHYSDIEGTGLRSLDAGQAVSFELAPGKDGRPKAVRVRREGASRSVARPAPRTHGATVTEGAADFPSEDPEIPEAVKAADVPSGNPSRRNP